MPFKKTKTPDPGQMNSQDYRLGDVSDPKHSPKKAIERVQKAVEWRKNAKYDETWAKLIKLYASRYDYPELSSYEDIIAPNVLFSTANVIIPSVSVNYPKISVTARKEYDQQRAATVEAVANYEWQHNDVHIEFGLAVKDFVVIGHGWAKTTWKYVEEERDLTDEEWQQAAMDAAMQHQAELQAAMDAGVPTDDFAPLEDIIASVPTSRMVAIVDRADVERISPFDIYVDPDATRLSNALWIAQRLYVPLETARSREDWNKKAREALKPAAMREAKSEIDLMFEGEDRGDNADYAVVWEYYDLVNGETCTFGDGCDDEYLIPPSKVDMPFAHPYMMLRNYEIPDKFYPIGDLEVIAPLQMELSLTRTQMINDRKRYRRMYLYRSGSIGADGLEALTSGDDNALIDVTDDEELANVVAPVQTTSLPPEFYNQTAMILDDIRSVSGVTEYQQGSAPEIRRTATEANMIQDGANARSAAKLAIVERGIGEIAQRVVQLSQQFLTSEQVARIVGPDDALMWVQYTREDLEGEWDFSVEAGSTMPQNESSRRQSAMQLMDAMAPFVGTVVDPRKIAEYVLRQGFGIKNPQDFLIAPEDLQAAGIDPTTGMPLPPPPEMPGGAPPPVS